MVPAAAVIASTAAGDSGARPRLVCTRTPVALSTGRRLLAVAGSASRTAVDGVVGGELAGADPLLDAADGLLDQGAAQPLLRRPHPRLGEQGVGARHRASRVLAAGLVGHRTAA